MKLEETRGQHHDAVRISGKNLGHPVHRLGERRGTGLADDVAAQRSRDVEAAADRRKCQEAVAARERHEEATSHGIRRA